MNRIANFIKTEPIRAYETAAALVALVAILVPALPALAVLAVVVPLLGVGEHVRSNVTPAEFVYIDTRELSDMEETGGR